MPDAGPQSSSPEVRLRSWLRSYRLARSGINRNSKSGQRVRESQSGNLPAAYVKIRPDSRRNSIGVAIVSFVDFATPVSKWAVLSEISQFGLALTAAARTGASFLWRIHCCA